MDVKEAVAAAKTYVADLFADEGLSNLGLEEVEYDDARDIWHVTVGFSRPWEQVQTALTVLGHEQGPKRSYKEITVSDRDGKVLSVKNRFE